jgi:hypothetical protein
MALFERKVSKAAISEPVGKAAAAGGGYTGQSMIGAYYTYQEGEARNRAMSVPAISRARDLMASVISCMPLIMYKETWNEQTQEMETTRLAPRSWLRRMSPSIPNSTLLSWLFDDIFFYGVGYLAITARTQDGYPSEFERLPAGSITRRDQSGPVFFAPSKELYFLGQELDYRNVVQFISGIQGIIYQSPGVVNTALKLESSRYRNAESLIPSGVLKQTGGEPLSPSELSSIGAQFESARKLNQIAVLNEFLSFEPSQATPDKMLLIDAANYQALECARLTNVPPYLVGVSTGSYSYQSSQQARADLYIFGVKAYAECIANTLSMDNVLPRGTMVKFDASEYLEENYLADTMDKEDMPEENTQEEIAS